MSTLWMFIERAHALPERLVKLLTLLVFVGCSSSTWTAVVVTMSMNISVLRGRDGAIKSTSSANRRFVVLDFRFRYYGGGHSTLSSVVSGSPCLLPPCGETGRLSTSVCTVAVWPW